MRFTCLKTTELLRGDSLLFTTNSPEIPGTNLIDIMSRMSYHFIRVNKEKLLILT